MQPKFCSKCGNLLKEGDKFCRKCGAPIVTLGAPSGNAAPNRSTPNIPSFSDVEEKLNRSGSGMQASEPYNPEGTVLLGGPSVTSDRSKSLKKADITLSFEDMLRGCSKVVDFGTGQKFELVIPAGLSPGDTIIVKDTGIVDPGTGKTCDIELTANIG